MVPKISLLFLWSVSVFASTGSWNIDSELSSTQFLAVGKPSLLKIKGEGGKPFGVLKGEGGKYSGEISLNLENFKTGIETRDKHMKEKYLETSKFAVTKISIEGFPESCLDKLEGEKSCEFLGRLNLHGVEKPINGKVTAMRSGANIKLKSEFKINLTDYAINIPSFAGVTVADEVTIQSDLILK